MAHEVPDLPYDFGALEPHIDAKTMEIHHDKHHAAYVKNLNTALEKHADLQKKDIEEILGDLSKLPDDIRTAVRNNGGGHLNHSLFWPSMSPDGGGEPEGDLAAAIKESFSNFSAFKSKLSSTAVGQFGSGWGWLSAGEGGKLQIEGTPNQDNPISQGRTPLLGVDVWEHAYYLKYQNKRADYLEAWWNVVNWEEVARRFKAV